MKVINIDIFFLNPSPILYFLFDNKKQPYYKAMTNSHYTNLLLAHVFYYYTSSSALNAVLFE